MIKRVLTFTQLLFTYYRLDILQVEGKVNYPTSAATKHYFYHLSNNVISKC